jgi:hypothetical protein
MHTEKDFIEHVKVLTCSSEDNRFKEAWEFGGLRRRDGVGQVDDSFEE